MCPHECNAQQTSAKWTRYMRASLPRNPLPNGSSPLGFLVPVSFFDIPLFSLVGDNHLQPQAVPSCPGFLSFTSPSTLYIHRYINTNRAGRSPARISHSSRPQGRGKKEVHAKETGFGDYYDLGGQGTTSQAP